MDLKLAGKKAIVTGASGLIGEAIARDLACEGVNLALCYRSHGCDQLTAEIKELGVQVITVQADVSKAEEAAKLVKVAIDGLGGIDILVNNAGIALAGSVESTLEEDWDRIMAVNMKSVYLLSREVIPYMRPQRWGRIINIGSVVAKTSTNARPWHDISSSSRVGGGAYAASKAGVHTLTKTLAKELAPFDITVNCVAPGPVKTAMVPSLPEPLAGQIPLGRLGLPEEISAFVALLASPRASFTTGEIIDVNGGLWMD